MKRQKIIFAVVTLVLIGGTALLLAKAGSQQKLGPPGIKASPIPNSMRWQIELPENVLDFTSTNREPDEKSLEMLPPDTSIVDRVYRDSNGFLVSVGAVLMGADRTSIHKAKYCLQGQGMHIDQTTRETVHIERPQIYDLPVIKLVATVPMEVDHKMVNQRLIYVYWYVADNAVSADESGFERMWLMGKKLLLTGELQRWAYVRYYAFCAPGEEDAAFDRMKKMIAASVPEFQLTPKPALTAEH